MGLPFVVLNMVSAVLFKDLGISDSQIAFWTSLILSLIHIFLGIQVGNGFCGTT